MAAGPPPPPSASLPTDNPANYTPNVLDGQVDSIWQVGNRVIIGGTFTQVANAESNGGQVYARANVAAFDATTGLVDTGFAPVLNGPVTVVHASASPGSIYLGGDFNAVNGTNRRKLARVNLADGSLVTGFNLGGANGLVRDLRLAGDQLYVSGLFTTINGQPRTYLASVNPTTGALTSKLNLAISGLHNGGTGKVIKIDVTPDGSRMAIEGNFTTIAGQARRQVALIDLSTTPATLSPWSTTFYTSTCASAFDSYLRDLDISPDGSYMVFSTTGAYTGATTACDTIARFELTDTPNSTPTWSSVTGGDTTYATEIHDGVVYVGGHMRWVNNPYAGDTHGAGGVSRPGMAALDAQTGVPYSWNPTRTRGVGLFDYHVTDQGIWAGSDTDRFNNEQRGRLAFFPWAGGSTVPGWSTGELPNDVFVVGRTAGTTGSDPSVLHRVNAGGALLASADDGPDWVADNGTTSPYHNTGGTAAPAPNNLSTPENDASVPNSDFDRPPAQLWTTYRWDAAGGNEMQWTFPVTAGTPIQVRLYFGNRCTCTNDLGERVFDVDLDNVTVLDDLDMSGQVGHDIGFMRAFDITSDGTVNINFRHGVENPMVNGIEIVRRDVPGTGTLGQQDEVQRIGFDGTTAGTPVTTAGTVPWRHARGAFMVNGVLVTAQHDGSLVRRGFDGTTYGPGTAVDMWSNTIMGEMTGLTGIFFDPASRRVYYTRSGQSSLFWRSYNPESQILGPIAYTAGGDIAALNPSRVRGMFVSGNTLYFGDNTTGNLLKVAFAGNTVTGPVAVANSAVDWRGRALFMVDGAQPNVDPTAEFQATCTVNECALDGTTSTDSDGSIVSYAWDFGDGQTGTGATASHTYAAGGTYAVALTVTDDRGGVDTVTHDVTVEDPPNVPPSAAASGACTLLDCAFDGAGSFDPDGSIASYAWDFGDGQTSDQPSPTHTFATAGERTVTLTVTDDDGATDEASVDVETVDPAGSALFRASATANTTTANASVTVPATVQPGDQLVYVVTANLNTTATTPAGWTLRGTRQDGTPDLTSWVFTRTADAASAGSSVSATLGGSGKVSRMLLAYSNAAPAAVVTSSVMGSSSTALATPSATVTYTGSAVVGYWADKSAGNTGWTLPGAVDARAASVGSGTGRVTAAAGDSVETAGTWPGATANSAVAGTKGVGWTIVLPPATGNFAPTAAFTTTCTLLACDLDATASSDPDGTIATYAWDFGDGQTGSGVTPAHIYAADGTYQVTLTVTDDDGATAVTSVPVSVSLTDVDFRASVSANTSTANASLTVPSTVQNGDQLLYVVTANVATTITTPAGWTRLATQDDGTPDIRSWVFTRTADEATGGTTVSATLGVSGKVSRTLLAYADAAPITTATGSAMAANTTSLTTPDVLVGAAGSLVVGYWADKGADNTGWTLPAGVTSRTASVGSGTGHITAAAADAGVATGLIPGRTATASASGSKGTAWSIVVSPS